MFRLFTARFMSLSQDNSLVNHYLKTMNKPILNFNKQFIKVKNEKNIKNIKINLNNPNTSDIINNINKLHDSSQQVKYIKEVLTKIDNIPLQKINNLHILLNILLENNEMDLFYKNLNNFLKKKINLTNLNMEYFIIGIVKNLKSIEKNVPIFFKIYTDLLMTSSKINKEYYNYLISIKVNSLFKAILSNNLNCDLYIKESINLLKRVKLDYRILFNDKDLLEYVFKKDNNYIDYKSQYEVKLDKLEIFLDMCLILEKNNLNELLLSLKNEILTPNNSMIYSNTDYFKINSKDYEYLLSKYKQINNSVAKSILGYTSYINKNIEFFKDKQANTFDKLEKQIYYYFYFNTFLLQDKNPNDLNIFFKNKENLLQEFKHVEKSILELKIYCKKKQLVNLLNHFYEHINNNIIINIEKKRIKAYLYNMYNVMKIDNLAFSNYDSKVNSFIKNLSKDELINIHLKRKSKNAHIGFLSKTNMTDTEFANELNNFYYIDKEINSIRSIPKEKRTEIQANKLLELIESKRNKKRKYYDFLYKPFEKESKFEFLNIDFHDNFNKDNIILGYISQNSFSFNNEEFFNKDLFIYENSNYSEMLEFINWSIKENNFYGLYLTGLYLESSFVKLPKLLNHEFLFKFNMMKKDYSNEINDLNDKYKLQHKYTLSDEYNSPLFDNLYLKEINNLNNLSLLENEKLDNSLNKRRFNILKEIN